MENTLFSTQAVQEVVENANFSFLEDFFRSLSPEVFGPSLPLLVEKWKKWPQKSGYFSFKIIEELDREQAQVLAREFLQDENSLFDIDKSSAVTQFIASTVMSGNDELAEQYLKRVEEVPNPFLKEIYERIAFSTALAGGVDLGRKVFRNLIVTGIEKENLGNILGDIYMY
ncbi:hypothetical protein KJ865_04880, partial [Myxococcota bacterium]|nr:hypothetical protein [Myxococcota bacterium]